MNARFQRVCSLAKYTLLEAHENQQQVYILPPFLESNDFVGLATMDFQYQPGIYKTTKALSGHESQISANLLVLVRTDGEFAPASILVPVRNLNNQWRFQLPGVKISKDSFDWGQTLVKLPREGFYRLTSEFSLGESGHWPPNTIVQLGYNRAAEPIIFIAQRRVPLVSNDLFFSDKGVKIEMAQLSMLEALAWYQEPERSQKVSKTTH